MESPYAQEAPSSQQTLDLFKGSWVSALPLGASDRSGASLLFDDPRIHWGVAGLSEFGIQLPGARIIDFGPLEGGHAYMLSRLGAASVTAIEAHRDAFLRCLVAKELLGVQRVNFLFGDAIKYLKQNDAHFDIGIASGFLYHLANPVEAIELLCQRCRAVFLWSMYWDAAYEASHPEVSVARTVSYQAEHHGFAHTLHRNDYGQVTDYQKFYGGNQGYSSWMECDEIVACFRHFGHNRIRYEREQNPNGMALRLISTR